MRLRHALIATAFAVSCLCLTISKPVSAQEKETKTSKAEPSKEVEALKKTVDALKDELSQAKKALDATKKEVGDLGTKLGKVGESATDAKTVATEGSAKVDALKKTASELEKKILDFDKTMADGKKGGEDSVKDMEAIKTSAGDAATAAQDGKDRADTSWMLVSSAFVMLMVPGLALFYGGMVRRKNILATMMQSMACLCIVGIYWVAFGYGLAFGPSIHTIDLMGVEQGGVLGWSWKLFFLQDIGVNDKLPGYNIPVYVHVMFQGMFAIITPALISGAVAERIRFWPFCIFCILWITVVYCPLAHMVWAWDWFYDVPVNAEKGIGGSAVGLFGKMAALDFAGGTVVHIAAGFAGLAACLVMRRRTGYPKTVIHPNSMVVTLLGAGLLWFGWFGFNGGSGLNATGLAGSAFAATQAAAAAAGLSWIVVEWILKGKPTALGLASGIVAGLVAVTPASGYVYIWGGAAIGALAGIVCYFAVAFKNLLGYDDSLDAFGVHGVGGFLGAVLTGIFCYTAVNSAGGDGYFAITNAPAHVAAKEVEIKEASLPDSKTADKLEDLKKELEGLNTLKDKGPFDQLIIQVKASVFSAVFAFVVTTLLVLLVQAMTLGNFTTTAKDELTGLDQTEHGETGFDFGLTDAQTSTSFEPKAATMPKSKINRFELAVEGVPAADVSRLWTGLCQPSEKPVSPDFLVVYPAVTTFTGNRFRCRGADATVIATRMESLFKKLLPGKPIKVVRL